MKTKAIKERPFELLRRYSGEAFGPGIVKNWYIARKCVDEVLINCAEAGSETAGGFRPFKPNSGQYLHVVLANDSDRMLAIARQLALMCHFFNFREEGDDGRPACRTVLTIVSADPDIKSRLCCEEWLCNLPRYCRYSEEGKETENPDSYIDIEIKVASKIPPEQPSEVRFVFTAEAVDEYFDNVANDDDSVFTIDTRIANFTGRMYNIGEAIDNLEAVNIHDAKRYDLALDVFQHVKLAQILAPMFGREAADQCSLKEALSNIFCSDCFLAKSKVVKQLSADEKCSEKEIWIRYNETISRSEHSRWIVEKLIMGYRPLNDEEQQREAILKVEANGNAKLSDYWRRLKRNSQDPAHVDLRSYRDLRRIHPASMKYDSFLNLAIPKILKKIGVTG